MNIENHVVSLDLAKQLKEAGYPQESLHWWGGISNYGIWCDHVKNELPDQETRFVWYAAPLASELGEQLLSNLDEFVRYNLDDLDTNLYFEWCNTDHPYYNPDLLAKTWILMKKEGLLTQ